MRRVSSPLTLLLAALLVIGARSSFGQTPDPKVCEGQEFPYFCEMIIDPPAFEFGSAAWADVNGDSLFDLIVSANIVATDQAIPQLQIWRNRFDYLAVEPPPDETKPPLISYYTLYTELNASESFAQSQELSHGAIATSDLNGDGRVDIVVTGEDANGVVKTLIFQNTGLSTSEFEQSHRFSGITEGGIAAADFDNDGDTDIIMTGQSEDGVATLLFLENELRSSGQFVESALPLGGVVFGSIDVGDYDGDQDMDVLLTGQSASGNSVTRILRNDNGTLNESGLVLPGLLFSRARFVDFDADGDLDVALTGARLSPFVASSMGILLENTGAGFVQFSEFPGRFFGGIAVADVNLDGGIDIIPAGGTTVQGPTNALFLSNPNQGNNLTAFQTFGGGLFGNVVLGDYDGDNDLDVLLYGKVATGGNRFIEYRNEGAGTNEAPQAPALPLSVVGASSVSLSWIAGSDAETPAQSLTYNIRVGTSPEANDIVPSNALSTGRRLFSAPGNVGANLGWHLDGLEPGTYYWSVQTIDAALAGSSFTDPVSFVVN